MSVESNIFAVVTVQQTCSLTQHWEVSLHTQNNTEYREKNEKIKKLSQPRYLMSSEERHFRFRCLTWLDSAITFRYFDPV